MSEVTWQRVAQVLAARWPSGPLHDDQGWQPGEAEAAVAEMKKEVLTSAWALVGLRASTSSLAPSAAEVREVAFRAMGVPLR